ncbi:MAG TPA: amidohydrolase family protein [Candidatus Paceibacterota bacterium]|nr:amidohydrolase family protein [Verrucomicrobiota bacterium]HOX02488.1 amidohydrolase family protein [Verrucomicrobiota bacterium]HRZ45449.1 amidohydrolase family protein [Candidatus Paceibacterota bacterium]HRZ93637.1 amidohydrolase family protein [Candidatus Paceibacterota bacterium]
MNADVIAHNRGLAGFLEANGSRLTMDADVHATDLARLNGELRRRYDASPNYYHGRPVSAEEILAEMGSACVDMALIWQNPAATAYAGDPRRDFDALLAANRYIAESARRHPDKFLPAGWTDPKALGLDRALELVDVLVGEFGFLFVKINPAQNRFPIDSEPVRILLERIAQLGAIPAFHFGADTPFTPAEGLERVAALHPGCPILAIHMGGGGAGYVEADDLYRRARELGLRQPNIRFVLSAKRDTHIESDLITYQLAGEPFCRNLFCGSDAPYGRMSWNFGGARAMLDSLQESSRHGDARVRAHPGLFTPEIARNFLGRNFAEFAAAGYRRLLQIHGGPAAPETVESREARSSRPTCITGSP